MSLPSFSNPSLPTGPPLEHQHDTAGNDKHNNNNDNGIGYINSFIDKFETYSWSDWYHHLPPADEKLPALSNESGLGSLRGARSSGGSFDSGATGSLLDFHQHSHNNTGNENSRESSHLNTPLLRSRSNSLTNPSSYPSNWTHPSPSVSLAPATHESLLESLSRDNSDSLLPTSGSPQHRKLTSGGRSLTDSRDSRAGSPTEHGNGPHTNSHSRVGSLETPLYGNNKLSESGLSGHGGGTGGTGDSRRHSRDRKSLTNVLSNLSPPLLGQSVSATSVSDLTRDREHDSGYEGGTSSSSSGMSQEYGNSYPPPLAELIDNPQTPGSPLSGTGSGTEEVLDFLQFASQAGLKPQSHSASTSRSLASSPTSPADKLRLDAEVTWLDNHVFTKVGFPDRSEGGRFIPRRAEQGHLEDTWKDMDKCEDVSVLKDIIGILGSSWGYSTVDMYDVVCLYMYICLSYSYSHDGCV